VLKENDDDEDEHFVDVPDDDADEDKAITAADAAANTTNRTADSGTASAKSSSWVHRNNLTCAFF